MSRHLASITQADVEAEDVALYATKGQIARLVLGEGKDIGPPAISAGPDDELRDLQ